MYPQGLRRPDWELAPELSKGGLKMEKSKVSSPPLDKEDTMWTQLSLLELLTKKTDEQLSYMPEFQAAVKNLTLNNKYSFFSLTIPMRNLSPTSAADSTLEEKVYKPYWTEFSQTLVNLLSLPTKIGFAVLGSILSHGCVLGSRLKYWFSTKRTSAQKEKSWQIFWPLSTSLVTDSRDSESTKNTLTKTLTYRVYPSKELEKIWKKWVAAVRKVYNISIAYLNQHQGYTKVGDKGGKMGFRTMLKASELIPQWCVDLSASKILDNASMEAYTAWFNTQKNPKFIGKGKNRKPHPQAGLKIAKFRSIRDPKLTIQFDPTNYKNGTWMISTTKHLPKPEFKGHDFCPLTNGATELTYNKGRWFAHFPVEFEPTPQITNKVIALDPGIRTFMTGFDGSDFLEFGSGDFNRLARQCWHLDKLKSRHDQAKGEVYKRLRYKLRHAMERIRTRIKNLRSECHKQVASYLARNYDIIVLPTFETSEMVVRKKRKLKNKTARAMMTWAFYQFSQTLEYLCNRYGSRLVRITEEYTSKTCSKCGHIHPKLGGSKLFKCPHCDYEIPRDFNGAVGIFLKALWDSTFTNTVGDVILDVQDVQDVSGCLG